MSERRVFRLVHQLARQRAAQCIASAAPEGWIVEVKPPTRSSDQNALLHAALTDIARQCEWAGRKWDVESWKRLLTAAWCRATGHGVEMVPAVDGKGFDVLYRRTSKLDRREFAGLCEYIFAWGTENGVEWTEPAEVA